jgi:hypothetical protein
MRADHCGMAAGVPSSTGRKQGCSPETPATADICTAVRPCDREAVQIGHLTPYHVGRQPGAGVSVKRTDTGGEFSGLASTSAEVLARQSETPAGGVLPSCCPSEQTANFEFATSVGSFDGHPWLWLPINVLLEGTASAVMQTTLRLNESEALVSIVQVGSGAA